VSKEGGNRLPLVSRELRRVITPGKRKKRGTEKSIRGDVGGGYVSRGGSGKNYQCEAQKRGTPLSLVNKG